MFFGDVILEYFLRIIYQLFAALFTIGWDRADAKLVHAESREGGGAIGSALTRLEYKYKVDGQEYSGQGWNAFLTAGSAKKSREYYQSVRSIRVRISKSDRARSFFCLIDQS